MTSDPNHRTVAVDPSSDVREHSAFSAGGRGVLALVILVFVIGTALITVGGLHEGASARAAVIVGSLANAIGFVACCGLVRIPPDEALVLTRFGRYAGTVRRTGMRWVDPLTTRRRVEARTTGHQSDR